MATPTNSNSSSSVTTATGGGGGGSSRVTYAVGDFVYFDDPTAMDAPYQIRKIDELVKTEKGHVDARCVVYLRRRDIPQHLLKIADQAQRRFDNYYEVDKKKPENFTSKGFVVANGAPESTVKEEDPEDDDGPPKIDQEEAPPARVNAGRTSSTEAAPEDVVVKTSSSKDEKENLKEKAESEAVKLIDWGDGGLPLGVEKLTKEQRLRLRQHEVFMTRQSEILPASLIRGKCRVVLLGDCEEATTYLPHDDTFFHSLVFDPNQQTLLADKGAIRVGNKYQAIVDDWMEPAEREEKERLEQEAKELAEKVKKEEEEERKRQEKADEDADAGKDQLTIDEDEEMPETPKEAPKEDAPEEPKDVPKEPKDEEMKEEKEDEKEPEIKIDDAKVEPEEATPPLPKDTREVAVWHPHHDLRDRDIDQYLIIARSVGLFARAIDGASAPKLPTLQLAAAFASRDVTILHAHAILHQSNYDVGQAVKYLVPIASREAYPCQVDDVSGLQTKNLGGPILCRDQLEEWSTPEINLFEDALDKCGKDFNEIRADYLPWKSIRDIVEYYYLMKASNRYTDRKKNKSSATSSDEKITNIYIPPFSKAIPASVLPYNATQTLVRSEVPCENCGTLDGINWYQWGGVEKKVLCSGCWTKWKKFAGLDQKHDLERFDKTRPPVLDQPSAPSGANGSDKPPVLQQQQQRPAVGAQTPQQRAAAQLAGVRNGSQLNQQSRQSLLAVAKEALQRGQITNDQFISLSKNFAMQTVQQAQQMQQQQVQQAMQQAALQMQANAQASAGGRQQQAQLKKVTPATKPAVVFYTTICRRAVRRLLPKTALNLRKLSRRPTASIDEEKILRAMILFDKRTLLASAMSAAGDKKGLISEPDFHKGITHLQHTLTSAVTGKRSAASGGHSGEPAAKMAKLSSASSPSPYPATFTISHGPTTPLSSHQFARPRPPVFLGQGRQMVPSLEDVGNTLLAVKQAMKFTPPSQNSNTSTPLLRQFLAQGGGGGLGSATLTSSAFLNLPRVIPSLNLNLDLDRPPLTYNQKIRKLLRTPTDSRWWDIGDEKMKLRAGTVLKTRRRQLLTRHDTRHIARHPCTHHEFLEPYRPIIHPLFTLTPPPSLLLNSPMKNASLRMTPRIPSYL